LTSGSKTGNFVSANRFTKKQMMLPILVLVVILLLSLGGIAAVLLVFRQKQPVKEITAGESLPFHWTYTVLPVTILLLSVVLTAVFYHRLPTEVAYNFKLDGSPDNWFSREMLIVWMLVPQLILTLLAATITWGITKLGIPFQQMEGRRIRPGRIVSLMGNMVALPQIILCFALVDVFSYNLYGAHIMPLWLFALIITVLGAIILGIFFISAVRRA